MITNTSYNNTNYNNNQPPDYTSNQPPPACPNCGLMCEVKTSYKPTSQNQQFYKCPNRNDPTCSKFFQWVDSSFNNNSNNNMTSSSNSSSSNNYNSNNNYSSNNNYNSNNNIMDMTNDYSPTNTNNNNGYTTSSKNSSNNATGSVVNMYSVTNLNATSSSASALQLKNVVRDFVYEVKARFGHLGFRLGQRECIEAALRGIHK